MKIAEQFKAKKLRQKGYSLNEISRQLGVSKSSVSLWVRSIELSSSARKRINARFTEGQLLSQAYRHQQTALKEGYARDIASKLLKSYVSNVVFNKIVCAMVYYCEGVKDTRSVVFTNSDPKLVATFLKLFRSSFDLDERKFRVCVHLHSYHDKDEQLKFWSNIVNIPIRQFIKPYHKQNSGLYRKDGYQGCASIRYHDSMVARELKAVALEFMNKGL